ncbi:MAG: hypothetical protein AAFV07_06085, partial [Bacteroidota bacterium]
MPTPRPVESLCWLLNASDYNKFEHWLQVVPLPGKTAGQLALFKAMVPFLKKASPDHVLPHEAWDEIARNAFGDQNNPSGTLHRYCSHLVRSLIGYFAMLQQREKPGRIYVEALRYCSPATFRLTHQALYKRAKWKIADDPSAQTLENYHILAEQLHNFSIIHPNTSKVDQEAAARDRRQKNLELSLFQLYKLAIVYQNRDQMVERLGKAVTDLLDSWNPDPMVAPSLSLYHKAYTLIMGPDANQIAEPLADAYLMELEAMEKQLTAADFATLAMLAYKVYWNLYKRERDIKYYFSLAQIIWTYFRNDASMIRPQMYRNWVNVLATVVSISEGDISDVWLSRQEIFVQFGAS